MSDPWYADGRCPRCGGRVTIEPDCPGWPSTSYGTNADGSPRIMVCQGCGNATLYECEREECGWAYRIPNNRPDAQGPPPTAWEAKDVMP